MRKPTEALRAEADLQAIQTSVAFKNISDAVEQYRRQFGLAFLAMIAFSAVHVGLVVIANLYTLETRVSNGKLSAASDSSTRPIPVATAKAEQVTDLAYIMSNLGEDEQRKLLSSMESIDFVDSLGDYRKYTVTGFQLGGYKRGDLKLFTAVGHVLTYIRGSGLKVDEAPGTSNSSANAPSKRKLLSMPAAPPPQSYAYTQAQSLSSASFHSVTACCDQAMVSHITTVSQYVDSGSFSGSSNFQSAASLADALEICYASLFEGVFDGDSTTDVTYKAAGIQSFVRHYLSQLDIWLDNQGASASDICVIDMFGNVQTNTYDDDESGNMAYLTSGCQLGAINYAKFSDSYFHSEEEPYAALEAFDSWTDCLKGVAKGVLYEYSVVAGGATDTTAINARAQACNDVSCSDYVPDTPDYLTCMKTCFEADNILANSVSLQNSGVSSVTIGGRSVSLSSIIGSAVTGEGPDGSAVTGEGPDIRRKLLGMTTNLGTGVNCDATKYGVGEGITADSVFFNGVGNGQVNSEGNSVDSLASWTDAAFQHNMCYLGITVPDLIMLVLDSNFISSLQNLDEQTWAGGVDTMSYNGISYHMADYCANWDTVTGPGSSMSATWSQIKSVVDVVVTKAVETIDSDVTDCMGRNAKSFMAAARVLISTADTYFADIANVQAVVDYWVSRSESLEEEAYAFEIEMDNAILPKCGWEAYKCWFKHNKVAIQAQLNKQLTDAVTEAKTWKAEGQFGKENGVTGVRDQNFVVGNIETQITIPTSCDIPTTYFVEEDGDLASGATAWSGNSFEAFLTLLGNGLTLKTFNSTSGTWGDDSWETCEYCSGTLDGGGMMTIKSSTNTCPNMPILNALMEQMTSDWALYVTAYDEGQAMLGAMRAEELEQIQSLTSQGWSHAKTQTFSHRAEQILADIALVHIPEIVSENIDVFNSFKTDNLWGGFKEVNMTLIDTTNTLANTWGCTGETLAHWQQYETKFGLVGYDACNVGTEDKYRKPFVTGLVFSTILAAYDPFSVYLSTTYCTGLMTAIDNGYDPLFTSSYDGWNSELLVMLHGFGGDHSFLHLSAATMFFMDRGTSRVNLGSEDNESFDITTCSGSVHSGCTVMMAPGGFIVLAPDLSACPLSLRTWYTNSEFSGFVLDYVLYEIPEYISGQLGTALSRFGIFGFSMGGYGTMGALTTYPYMAGQASSFNAPVYPGGCFFFSNCHQECAIDIVMCELEYTTTGMAINSYVLIFEDSMVVSQGAMDPMGYGVAFHLHAYGDKEGEYPLQCGSYEFATGTGRSESYYTKSSVSDLAGECSWQDWGNTLSCATLTGSTQDFLTMPDVFQPHPTVYRSIRMALNGYGSVTTTAFVCPSGECRSNAMGNVVPDFLVEGSTCSIYDCSGVRWCAEYNMAEGSGAYLDPLKATISSAKFVPASVPTSGQFASLSSAGEAVASAYGKFAVASPLLKFYFNKDMFSEYTTLLYMHCSQNDEYDLFTPHATYAELLMSTFFNFSNERKLLAVGDVEGYDNTYFNSASTMGVDFSDCDWHRYTEADLQKTMLVFSDNFRVYTNSLFSATIFATKSADVFTYCFLSTYGFSPSWSVHGGGCPDSYFGDAATEATITKMYTAHEWDVAHSFNEVECDITALMLMIEELADLADSNTSAGCTVSVSQMIPTSEQTGLDFTRTDPANSLSAAVCSATESIGAFSENECTALCVTCTRTSSCVSNMATANTLAACEHLYGTECAIPA